MSIDAAAKTAEKDECLKLVIPMGKVHRQDLEGGLTDNLSSLLFESDEIGNTIRWVVNGIGLHF
jgi:hypothetical protein